MKSKQQEVVLVVASALNDVIGWRGDMPWHQPADLAHFKALTIESTILMGRKTFESIGSRPLPRRRNLVLTRQEHWSAPGVDTVNSLQSALALAGSQLFVIGGAELYRQALPIANRIEWTRMHAMPAGDAWFRPDLSQFQRQDAQHRPADERNALAMDFEKWLRVGAPDNH